MMEDAQRRYPGAIWSLSIGWGCDKLITAADLAPIRAALSSRTCQRHHRIRRQRGPGRPGMQRRRELVDTAGTRRDRSGRGGLGSGDDRRRRHQPVDRPRRQLGFRTGLVRRPAGAGHRRRSVESVRPPGNGRNTSRWARARTAPDPRHRRGRRPAHRGEVRLPVRQVFAGGGTSLAAPLWAGITAVMDQYLARDTAAGRSATSTRCSTRSRRAHGCPVSGMSDWAPTPWTVDVRPMTWSPDSAHPRSPTSPRICWRSRGRGSGSDERRDRRTPARRACTAATAAAPCRPVPSAGSAAPT